MRRTYVCLLALLLLPGCSKAPEPKTGPVTFTYTKADVSPWPWTVASLTVTCTDTRGGATAVVNGTTYGVTGREATHDTIRGYGDITEILRGSDTAFDKRVEADCTAGMKGH